METRSATATQLTDTKELASALCRCPLGGAAVAGPQLSYLWAGEDGQAAIQDPELHETGNRETLRFA